MDDIQIRLQELCDDVIGVIISHIPGKKTLAAVCSASKRFYKIFVGVVKLAILNPPCRVRRYFEPSAPAYIPKIANGLNDFIINLRSACHAKLEVNRHIDDHVPGILIIVHGKCDACRGPLGNYNKYDCMFFKLHLCDIQGNKIGVIIVDCNIICKDCIPKLQNIHPVYYLSYTNVTYNAPVWNCDVNYQIGKVIFKARCPLIVENSVQT